MLLGVVVVLRHLLWNTTVVNFAWSNNLPFSNLISNNFLIKSQRARKTLPDTAINVQGTVAEMKFKPYLGLALTMVGSAAIVKYPYKFSPWGSPMRLTKSNRLLVSQIERTLCKRSYYTSISWPTHVSNVKQMPSSLKAPWSPRHCQKEEMALFEIEIFLNRTNTSSLEYCAILRNMLDRETERVYRSANQKSWRTECERRHET